MFLKLAGSCYILHMPKKQKSTSNATQAQLADKYVLYQESVQDPGHEVDFFDKAYKAEFGKKPVTLREDFCGTFAICCLWAKKKGRVAIGVDLDPEPLDWGRQHNLAKLKPEAQERVTLLQDDVRSVSQVKADVLAAQNFSFWIFKTRSELLAYFQAAYRNLGPQGLMILDMMGGYECFQEGHQDIHAYGKGKNSFKYVWDQARFDPMTHDATFHIHFRFKDGSQLSPAFTYDWRFWSIPEVRELLTEAGFGQIHVYWEGTDSDGDGDGKWKKRKSATSDPAWIAYLSAVKQ